MDVLFAPWRYSYIKATVEKGLETCVFCDAPQRSDDDALILYRGSHSYVIMNLYPYNAGHVMVCPNQHIGDFTALDRETLHEISDLTQLAVKAINKALKPHGFNLGYNLGRAAGAGLEEHIHNHIVPRWNGDTNFMPVIGEVKVISQDLKEIYHKIKKAIEEIQKGGDNAE